MDIPDICGGLIPPIKLGESLLTLTLFTFCNVLIPFSSNIFDSCCCDGCSDCLDDGGFGISMWRITLLNI